MHVCVNACSGTAQVMSYSECYFSSSHINSTVCQRGNHGDQSYIDAVLPFGLHSAPKNFNALADTLQEIVRQKGLAYVEHYVITVGNPHSDECAENLL